MAHQLVGISMWALAHMHVHTFAHRHTHANPPAPRPLPTPSLVLAHISCPMTPQRLTEEVAKLQKQVEILLEDQKQSQALRSVGWVMPGWVEI